MLSELCSLSDKDKSSSSSSTDEKDKQTEYLEAKIKLDSQWITKYVLVVWINKFKFSQFL